MKKLLLGLILSILFFFGCSQTDVLDNDASVALSFDTHIGKSSRAVSVSRFKERDTIGVYMYRTPTDWTTDGISRATALMINQSLTLDAGAWIYNPTLFWVKDEKYTFFAYAPYSKDAVIINGVLSYVVGADETKQQDLLYAVPAASTTDKTWDGLATLPDKVQFVFTHALSKVKFSVATEYDYSGIYTIELTDIKLNNLKTTGSLTLTAESAAIEPWSNQSTPGTIAYSPNAMTLSTTLQPVTNAEGDVWMLLPQTLPDDAEVKFKVRLTKVGTIGTAADGVYEMKASLKAGKWEHNKVYGYQVTLNMDQMLGVKPIVISDPTIVPWEEEERQEIYPVLAVNIPDEAPGSTATSISLIKSYNKAGSELQIVSDGSSFPWTIRVSEDAQSWLQLADNESGAGLSSQKSGIGSRIVYAYSTEVPYNGADRMGTITLSRKKAEDIIIHVTQGDFTYINGVRWARGNLYWKETEIAQDMPNSAGLYFKYGSLVGVKAFGENFFDNLDNKESYLVRPSGYTKTVSTWEDIPMLTTVIPASYEISEGTGDICKYLSDKSSLGSDDREWRLPTKAEAEKLMSAPKFKHGDFTTNSNVTAQTTVGYFFWKEGNFRHRYFQSTCRNDFFTGFRYDIY